MSLLWSETKKQGPKGNEKGKSLWIYGEQEDETQESSHLNQETENLGKGLSGEINADVVVIGGGMAGILTAFLLHEQGVSVVVLEKYAIGGGATGNTTAKITSQHGLIYKKLMTYKGEERAWEYAMANQAAIDQYARIIEELRIDCDFERLPNYVYDTKNTKRIKQEVEAAKSLGLPASFTRDNKLPFPIKSAIRFDNQAQFHPLKFLRRLTKELKVYENTRITQIHSDGLIRTENGSVKAKKVVIATHYPFINFPGAYFLKTHQERSYLAALQGRDGEQPYQLDGMYIDANTSGYTFRNYQNYLLVGTGKHRTGQYDPVGGYEKIQHGCKTWFPNSNIIYQWSNQDCMTPDKIPYIGRYSVRIPNFYVATGFNKWGMTSSMVAAMILKESIAGRSYEFRKVFLPHRMMISGTGKLLKDTGITAISLTTEFLSIPHDKLNEIERGHGGVIRNRGHRVGVYRDEQDQYHMVSTKCPHLGCKLEWNQNELTWDCPCHGSRFDYSGNLINNPATGELYKSRVKQ